MSEKYVIINIGRNVQNQPLSARNWQAFQDDVMAVVDSFATDHPHRLQGRLIGSGSWDGVAEDAVSYQVATQDLDDLREHMAALAYKWRQEAIAVVVSGPSALIRPCNPQENR